MKLLNKIQKELNVPKTRFNSFGKYYYRNCEDILEAVRPLLGEGTLLLTDEVVNVGSFNYVRATAILRDSEDSVEVSAYARESVEKKGMDDSQMTGTASSYARKYALNGLFAIDDTKDADTMDNTGIKTAQQKVKELNIKTAEGIEYDLGTCPDCGAPMKLKKEGIGAYCSALCWKK